MDKWKAILDYVQSHVLHPDTNIAALAKKSGVSVWWLYRLRAKPNEVKDPGFTKVGAVFQALGGRAPKVPRNSGEKNG